MAPRVQIRGMYRTLIAALLLGPAAVTAAQADILVTDAEARITRPGAPSGAAYMTIENTGPEADRLVSVETDAAAKAELHSSRMENGVMAMVPLTDGLSFAPEEVRRLAQGGDHVMLMGLKGAKPGETLDLTLVFEKAGKVAVQAPVSLP